VTAQTLGRALGDLVAGLDRPACRSGVAVIADTADVAALHPTEAVAVERAVAGRRAEFVAGRALLRRLLDDGHGEPVVVPAAPDRRPVLPAGVIASLAHDDEFVVAIAERDAPAGVTVGVDLERVGAVGAELAATVLRDDEAGLDPTVAFCAKEAAYKAWSMAGGPLLEHHDVHVTLVGATFTADVDAALDGPAMSLAGRWAVAAGRVLTVAVGVVDTPA
jgi:4'-phosphopantetheinyl transferase EntD